jgi:hypothetical protein
MSDEQDRLHLARKAIDALKARMARDSYMDVAGVMARWGWSRSLVMAIPMEILPYVPHGTPAKVSRRYHPADVLAADARLRAWHRAKAKGEGDEYLARLRAELDAADAAAIGAATEMRSEAARPAASRGLNQSSEDSPLSEYTKYRRTAVAEMADWHPDFDMTGVSVSDADRNAGSPKVGDKIARNPVNHADKWLVAAAYFALNFEAFDV